MDLFDKKGIKPMLIAELQEPFDSPDYIYELKLDGLRCIAYLEKNGTELRNKRNRLISQKFPELSNIHKAAKVKCILDGELFVFKGGKPDFSEVQKRSIMENQFRIELQSARLPASFTAFDILYYKDRDVTDLPLIERKVLLEKAIKENDRISIARFIEGKGIMLYQLIAQQELEGVVAKRKDSKYFFDKRTKDWIKFKRLYDDDFVICGYIHKTDGTSFLLGQYSNNGNLVYMGNVSSGLSRDSFATITQHEKSSCPFITVPKGNEKAIWIRPDMVCSVQWMPRQNGALNQPVFKGFRDDILAQECIER